MPVLQIKRRHQILQRLIDRLVSRTDLSDVIDSSKLKHILTGFAREMEDAYFQFPKIQDLFDLAKCKGDDLDEAARVIRPGKLRRDTAKFANGTVAFSRPTNTGATLPIPAGTLFKTETGVIAKTILQAQITNTSVAVFPGHGVGIDSNVVPAQAVDSGVAGNISADAVLAFVSKPAGVVSVGIVTAFEGGLDKESDDSFLRRLDDYVASLPGCNDRAIEFIALGIKDPTAGSSKIVRYSHLFEDPIDPARAILYIDDGAGTAETSQANTDEIVTQGLAGPGNNSAVGGEEFLTLDEGPVRLESAITLNSEMPLSTDYRGALVLGEDYYINPTSRRIYFTPPLVNGEIIRASYLSFTGLIQEVQKVITGVETDRDNYPGKEAAGALVRVLAPVVVSIQVTAVLSILEGFDYDDTVSTAKDNVADYINNLGISGDVVWTALIDAIRETPGVYDVELSVPSKNRTILDNEIPRIVIGDINIT